MWMKLMALGVTALGATLIASACGVAEDAPGEEAESGAAELVEARSCNPRLGPSCEAREACVLDRGAICGARFDAACTGTCVKVEVEVLPAPRPVWTYVSRDLAKCVPAELQCDPLSVPFFAADGCGCVLRQRFPCSAPCLPGEKCCDILGCCVDEHEACVPRSCNP